jgi:nucleoside-diphosphate-sugar epimerase
MSGAIIVTGSAGLIGKALVVRMAEAAMQSIGFDLRERDARFRSDLREEAAVERAIAGVAGIIHLGAVSRVVWGERDPEACWAVNVDATRCIVRAALAQRQPPWLIYASSREVYGQQEVLPVSEDAGLAPLNVYARSKVAAERTVTEAREAGLTAAVVRFSSVYGDVDDHSDRVVPAFAAAAAGGGTIRIDGPECGFDFTHVSDVASGVLTVAQCLGRGERRLPALHFVSGVRTTLRELSAIAMARAFVPVRVVEAPRRSFDVQDFQGDPARTAALLGWKSSTPLAEGVSRLVREFRSRVPQIAVAAEPRQMGNYASE